MPEPQENMTNGDTEAQPATGQNDTSAEDQLAIDRTQGDTTAQPATDATAPVDEPMIPKSRLDEVSQKAAEAEARTAQLEQQMAFMASQQQAAQAAAAPQAPPQEVDPYAEWDDYDYVPLEAARARDKQVKEEFDGRIQAIQNEVFAVTHPDFDNIVGKQNPITGQFDMSEHLTKALTKNPLATQTLQSQPNQDAMRRYAYQLAKQEADIADQAAANLNQQNAADKQQYVDNTVSARMQPVPGSSVGGDGGLNANTNVEGMNDAEFDEHERRVAAGDFD